MNKNESPQTENPPFNQNFSKKSLKKLSKVFLVFKALINLNAFFFNLKKRQIIFFGSHIHRVLYNGKYFNRFYDSMIDYHNLQNDVYMMEYQKIYDASYNKKAIIPLSKYLNYHKLLAKLLNRFKKEINVLNLNNYDAFYKELSNYNFNVTALGVSEKEIIDWTNRLKLTSSFFEKFFKKVNPKKVVFLGYYGLDDIYSALLVANNLNIETIDFQHGPQTNVHLAFAHWNKLPIKGFNTMPKTFWNWDNESKNSIDKWANNTNTIKSKVAGQPYVAYWTSKFNDSNENKKQYVFYSLQTSPFSIEDLLTPKIVKLIQENNYHWILRLHPRNNLNLDTLDRFLVKNNLNEKCIVQDAISSPLPEVLNSSMAHITNYSGCLIEARLLNVPTILINIAGKEMFNQYIDDKLVFYIEQDDEDFIKKTESKLEAFSKLSFKTKKTSVYNPLK
ncbi:hypothetical protein L3X39_06655 [Sabulilitoribacter multivorans]|uniref:Surface carbohydrate biosynthesis protein n=1 Tax=Flaviramulus multivorans TaxID=1304750 RepID=A0ABS9IIE3_9FLAO|nr:hypothetical protein [Flaviramulus multivorans]MCF7560316.1 hypothetical protein [Flaviramulus multivorans]